MNDYDCEIGQHNDELVVIGPWDTAIDDPEVVRLYWPTGIPVTSTTASLIGQKCRRDPTPPGTYRLDSGRVIRLSQGGDTYPVTSEAKPVPKPTRSRKWHWEYGRWVKWA